MQRCPPHSSAEARVPASEPPRSSLAAAHVASSAQTGTRGFTAIAAGGFERPVATATADLLQDSSIYHPTDCPSAAWPLRPISSAAVAIVRMGAPGRRQIGRPTADPVLTLPSRVRHDDCSAASRCSKAVASETARRQAADIRPIKRLMPWCASWDAGSPR